MFVTARFEMSTAFVLLIASVAVGPAVGGDFNGDSFADLVIGVPYEDVGGLSGAGAVNAIYGGASGLTATGNAFFHQDSDGIDGAAEDGDSFGWALAVGDFNGDGFFDLAVGVPWEDVGSVESAGAVNVIYGGSDGLSSTGDQLWTQYDCCGFSPPEEMDHFGMVLAVGDFDGDGYDDLAVGAPFEDMGMTDFVGSVIVLFGSSDGLTDDGIWLSGDNTTGTSDANDEFGSALTTGDFDGDGFDDLAIGVPGDEISGEGRAGSVVLLYGDTAGLTYPVDGGLWHQDITGVHGAAEANDYFGNELTAGDFDRDGYDDLVVGVPSESVDTVTNAGMINVLYGTSTGISAARNAYFHQDNVLFGLSNEDDDRFGEVLASGDFNGDGYCDLAVGAPYEDHHFETNAGMVVVLWGGFGGISGAGAFIPESAMNGGSNEQGNYFGYSLAAGDFNLDGRLDLAIGAPYRDGPSGSPSVGVAYVGYGVSGVGADFGLDFANGDMFSQCNGITGGCDDHDLFGVALASYPRSTAYIFASGFEPGETSEWSATTGGS